jgi:hypothetical protein
MSRTHGDSGCGSLLAQPLLITTLVPICLSADVHQLQAWYSLPLELARAIQAVGVNAVVAEHVLPQASHHCPLLPSLQLTPCRCPEACAVLQGEVRVAVG